MTTFAPPPEPAPGIQGPVAIALLQLLQQVWPIGPMGGAMFSVLENVNVRGRPPCETNRRAASFLNA